MYHLIKGMCTNIWVSVTYLFENIPTSQLEDFQSIMFVKKWIRSYLCIHALYDLLLLLFFRYPISKKKNKISNKYVLYFSDI